MKKTKKKFLTMSALALGVTTLSSVTAFAEQNSYIEDATAAAEENSQPSLLPKHGVEGAASGFEPMANNSRSTTSYTGGTLKSNTWLSSLHSGGLIDYQVSANYTKTDHQYIQTKWHATIEAISTSSTAKVTLSTTGGSVEASTTSTDTIKSTSSKYYQNTKSQKDASYRSNLAVQGKWKKVTLTNEASVWGNKVVKKAAINSQVSVSK
ncbi:hypothetical protein [Exiguobacterium sp. s48]|uniref:hypothetical protein n=1 Tax=Exiguobacterium sp. s48 TaxID=2751273 RepID=UPI001BE8AF54|nr:hypothetical protein [Exiguobacterium sp. s48]